MNVASLELSKELYELSGWVTTTFTWYRFSDGDSYAPTNLAPERWKEYISPAYDLGYLLRKLPTGYELMRAKMFNKEEGTREKWCITEHAKFDERGNELFIADTPEDATAKLAIELFKQSILTKGDK